MKYYVLAVVECTPTIFEFETVEKRTQWVNEFLLNRQHDIDSSIDMIFDGNISWIDQAYLEK